MVSAHPAECHRVSLMLYCSDEGITRQCVLFPPQGGNERSTHRRINTRKPKHCNSLASQWPSWQTSLLSHCDLKPVLWNVCLALLCCKRPTVPVNEDCFNCSCQTRLSLAEIPALTQKFAQAWLKSIWVWRSLSSRTSLESWYSVALQYICTSVTAGLI